MAEIQLNSLGNIFLNERKKLKLSQSEVSALLAEKGVDLSQKMYSNYENGEVKAPRMDVVLAIGEVLNLGELSDWLVPAIQGDREPEVKREEPQPQREQATIDHEWWGQDKIATFSSPFNDFELMAIIYNAYTFAALLTQQARGEIEKFRKYRLEQGLEDVKMLYEMMRPKEMQPVKNTL